MPLLKRLGRDRNGGVAVIFGLATLPIFAFVGFAVDYSRATDLRASLQKAADATALQMVMARQEGRFVDMRQVFDASLGPQAELEGLQVRGEWVGHNRFRVESDVPMPTTIGAIFLPSVDVGVVAIAEGRVQTVANEAFFETLQPDAHDFNELFAYCYDPIQDERLGPLNTDQFAEEERLEFKKVADNDWLKEFDPPSSIAIDCLPHEEISYMMRNTRGANKDRNLRGLPSTRVYEFFTDTTRDEDNPSGFAFNFGLDIVETILCRSLAECRVESEGGIIPDNRQEGRTPRREELGCREGYFLFVGIEDRPPEWGRSDRDYDDLRFVISCPASQEIRSTVRLVG
ncbi:MAG: TadE/TadG family type IV pilus assembly protein [Salinarimonas sp.]